MNRPGQVVLAAQVILTVIALSAEAADWPAYRMNNARTATTSESLVFPLSPVWKYVPAQKHQPAWPDPFLQRGRGKNFDAAPQPVIVGNVVYFGSTTDNTAWALDASNGQTKWGFTTGAPIRFAPAIADDCAYFVSDDGVAYCLDAASGKLIWKFRGGLEDKKLVGNGRMISRWPIRSGVAVEDGVVHFAVGMWSSEGVYVYALDAKSGKPVWCNDTNLDYLMMPHASTALTGNMPQGYLAIGGNRVVYNNSVGGSWVYDTGTGRRVGRFGGTGTLKKAKGGNYKDYKPSKFYNWSLLILNEKTGEIVHHGETEDKAEPAGLVPLHAALAGDVLIKCVGDKVVAIDKSGEGQTVWQHRVESTASGIAVANGMLVIASTDGAIHCFKSGEKRKPAFVGPGADSRLSLRESSGSFRGAKGNIGAKVLAELADRKVNRGFALVLGEEDAALAEAIAAKTEMQVICALTDEIKVAAERKRLRDTTATYGTRVTVDHWADAKQLPYPQLFANLVVVTNKLPALPNDELERVQRPCGGIVMSDGKVNVRGKLPGALDWNSANTSDQRVRGPMELLWFGEPGPTHAVKQTPSTAANGRLFVYGPNGSVLTGVDAYNGTVLWQRTVERKKAAPIANDNYVYFNNEVFDAQTGEPVKGGKRPPKEFSPRRSEDDEQTYLAPRLHPLTEAVSSKAHTRLHGCSSWASSTTMEFFRSSTISFYDYEDDSGIRNFSGLRPGCGDSLVPALGLMLYGESTGVPHGAKGSSCSCAYPFKTSLALAPTQKRRNEDWAVFQDIPWAQSATIRHAAINFGAPGDRRDDKRTLWLAAPRPQGPANWSIYRKVTFTLPHKPEFYDEARHFRRNSDRLAIKSTDRPWLYVSGYLGVKRLTWDLDYYNRYHQLLSLPIVSAPKLDGRMDEAIWSDASELIHPYTPPLHNADKKRAPIRSELAYARHDDDNLYFGYRKRLTIDKRGRGASMKATTKGDDAEIWKDDAFEFYLSDQTGNSVVHLGVSASGATYDSMIKLLPLPKDPQKAKAALSGKGPAPKEDVSWNGTWTSSVHLERERVAIEVAIPWKTLADVGIDKNNMKLNLAHVRSPWGRKPFTRRSHADSMQFNLSGTKPTTKLYTIRLHFAEPVNDREGQRVFDVVLGDKVVLKEFDVFAEAGGKNTALVKEIRGVPAIQNLVIGFISKNKEQDETNAPIISGLEIIAEQPGKLPKPLIAKLVRNRNGHKTFMRFADLEKMTEKQKLEMNKTRQQR